MSRPVGAVTVIGSQIARAVPSRRAATEAVRAPTIAPALPAEKRTPITPGEIPTWRTRKTTTTACSALEKKLNVPVHPAIIRRIG